MMRIKHQRGFFTVPAGLGANKPQDISTALSIYNKIVAWWERDETTGTTMEDAHTGNRDGTYSGVTLNQTGLAANLGTSVSFATAGSYAEVAHNAVFDLTGNLSCMVWARQLGAQTATFPKLLWKQVGNNTPGHANYLIQFNRSTSLVLFRVTSSSTNYDVQDANTWSASDNAFWVGVRNGRAIELWRNGSKVANNDTALPAVNTALTTSTATLRFAYAGASLDDFNGREDQAAVFSSNLTPTEIAYLYNSGSGKTYADLVADAGV